MKLLLIESTPGNANEINASLLADGHEVVTCADEHGGPCRGIDRHVECPMESHIDLTIVAREAGSAHTLAEMGSVCATRHRVPMVEVDPQQVDDELPSVVVANALRQARRRSRLRSCHPPRAGPPAGAGRCGTHPRPRARHGAGPRQRGLATEVVGGRRPRPPRRALARPVREGHRCVGGVLPRPRMSRGGLRLS